MGSLGFTPVVPSVPMALGGGGMMVQAGVQQHRPLLTIVGLAVVFLGGGVLFYLQRRQRGDAQAAGVRS